LKLILRAIKNCGLEDDDAVDGKKSFNKISQRYFLVSADTAAATAAAVAVAAVSS